MNNKCNNATISLYNELGQMIITKKLLQLSKQTVDLTSLLSGQYFVVFKCNEYLITKIFIK